MKQSQKAGIVGGLMALSFFAYNLYVAFGISRGDDFSKSLYPEVFIAIGIQIPLLAPALVLIFVKHFEKSAAWIFWSYPVVMGVGLLNTLLAKDPITAGLPMVLFVLPFCIIHAISVWGLKINLKSEEQDTYKTKIK